MDMISQTDVECRYKAFDLTPSSVPFLEARLRRPDHFPSRIIYSVRGWYDLDLYGS